MRNKQVEKLLREWDKLRNAIQRVETASPQQMSERIVALEQERQRFQAAMFEAALVEFGHPFGYKINVTCDGR